MKKAKYIKEGSFNETEGIPVIKVTGNIDLAEEVPVAELDPDKDYPYIQKALYTKLAIAKQDLYALIQNYKMKGVKRYHIAVTTSSTTTTHKFSEFALQFLQAKLDELKENGEEFSRIRTEYRQNRYKPKAIPGKTD